MGRPKGVKDKGPRKPRVKFGEQTTPDVYVPLKTKAGVSYIKTSSRHRRIERAIDALSSPDAPKGAVDQVFEKAKRKVARKRAVAHGLLPAEIPTEEKMLSDFKTYCEELLWIRNKRGNAVPFIWNAVQNRLEAQLDAYRKAGRQRFMILKYRRAGITTQQQARSFFIAANNENRQVVTLAHDNPSTQKIFEISAFFYQKLNEAYRPHRKTENKRELNFDGLGSTFYIGTAGGIAFGRGSTLQRVHASEVAFWPKAADVPVIVAGLQEAASHGEFVIETTANGVGNWFHKTWYAAKAGEAEWVPIFLSWKDDPELVIPTTKDFDALRLSTEEENIVRAYNLTPPQILWRRFKMRELFDPDRGELLFKQEYPINDIEAFISSGRCFFDENAIALRLDECSAPIQTSDYGRLKIWKEPELYHSYVVGADIGEGVAGGARTAITVMDVGTCEEVACWVGICSPEEAGHKMASFGRHYNGALLAPECNNYGHSTLNTLINTIEYPAIYTQEDYQEVWVNGQNEKPKFGWQTNAKTRPLSLSSMRHAVQQGLYRVNDKEFFSEAFGFTDNGHGKYEAAEGTFDDRIFAHAIAWSVRDKHLQEIDLTSLMVDTGLVSVGASLAVHDASVDLLAYDRQASPESEFVASLWDELRTA